MQVQPFFLLAEFERVYSYIPVNLPCKNVNPPNDGRGHIIDGLLIMDYVAFALDSFYRLGAYKNRC
jgi:hypothetical protein